MSDWWPLLRFRLKQGLAILQPLPWGYRIFILLALVATAFMGIKMAQSKLEPAAFSAGIGLFLVLTVHQLRNDRHWVRMHIDKPRRLYMAEYSLLTAMLWVPFLLTPNYWLAPLMLVGIAGVALLPLKESTARRQVATLRWLPMYLFEWRAGLRQHWFLPLFLYIACWLLHCWPYVALLGYWVWLSTIVPFYAWGEPREMLEAGGKNAPQFLKNKLRQHARWMAVLTLPFMLLHALLHPETLWLSMGLAGFGIGFVGLLIWAKYANYEPNERITAQQITIGIALYSPLIPFLLPLPFMAAVRYYRKALENIEPYWHAGN